MKIQRVLCGAIVCFLPAAGYPRAEKVRLQYSQPAGVTVDYRFELDGTIVMEQLEGGAEGAEGTPRTIVYRKELDSSVEVVERSDGEIVMLYRFGEGFVERGDGARVKRKDIDLRGRDIKILMKENGTAEVEDMGALEAVFRQTGAPSIDEPLFPVFPKKRLKIGATWKQKFTRRGLMIEGKPIHYVVRYRLARIEEYRGFRCAVIEGRGGLRLVDYHGTTRSGRTVDIHEAEEDIESVLYFAVDRGIPVESRKTVKRSEIREWEAKGEKGSYKDKLTTEVNMSVSLVGPGGR